MKAKIPLLLLILTFPVGVGCATLFSPGPDMVPVRSTPAGATVYLDSVESGKTPCIIAVPRSSAGVFRLELSGYRPVTVDRDKVVNGITCLNLGWIFFWPMLPVAYAVDIVSGDIGKYSTKPLVVVMEPLQQPERPPDILEP